MLLKSDGRLIRLASGRKKARTAQDVKRALHHGRLKRGRYVHGGGGNRFFREAFLNVLNTTS